MRLALKGDSCATEKGSQGNVGLAVGYMKTARLDLNLKYGGRCRGPALAQLQHAYSALEAEQRQQSGNQPHLDAIHQAMSQMREAEKAIQDSMHSDAAGHTGVNVTSIDNAIHTLQDAYRH